MKPEITKFYADKQLHIPKLITKRPADVTAEQVEAAAEKVYYDIQKGYEIKIINIARYVWQVAKDINADAYLEEHKILQDSKQIIADLYKKIAEKNRVIADYSKKITRFYRIILTYASIAAVLAAGLAAWNVSQNWEAIWALL